MKLDFYILMILTSEQQQVEFKVQVRDLTPRVLSNEAQPDVSSTQAQTPCLACVCVPRRADVLMMMPLTYVSAS